MESHFVKFNAHQRSPLYGLYKKELVGHSVCNIRSPGNYNIIIYEADAKSRSYHDYKTFVYR